MNARKACAHRGAPWLRKAGYGRSGVLIVALAAVAGCAIRPPVVRKPPPRPRLHARVEYRAVADKHLKTYRIAPSQSAIPPEPLADNPAPVYPSGLVARDLPPVTVTALLIVDATGRVRRVRIARAPGDDATRRAFDAAVRKAVRRWRFTPMRIADWVEDARGNAYRVDARAKPFSQSYRFRFAIRNGRPQVDGGVPGAVPGPQR